MPLGMIDYLASHFNGWKSRIEWEKNAVGMADIYRG